MTTDDKLQKWKIRNEKLQYDINREAAKISALKSGNINKHEYLTGKEILPFSQSQIKEQVKLSYFLPEKALEKQTKTIEDRAQKWNLITDQKSISNLFSKDFSALEARNKFKKIKTENKNSNRNT